MYTLKRDLASNMTAEGRTSVVERQDERRDQVEAVRSEHRDLLIEKAVEQIPETPAWVFSIDDLVWEKVPSLRDLKVRSLRPGQPHDASDGSRLRPFSNQGTYSYSISYIAALARFTVSH